MKSKKRVRKTKGAIAKLHRMSAPIALHECVLIPCNKRRCTYKCTYICIYMYMYYIWLYSSAYAMQLAQRVKRLQALTKLIRVIYPFRRSSRDFFFLFQLATTQRMQNLWSSSSMFDGECGREPSTFICCIFLSGRICSCGMRSSTAVVNS